MLVIIWGQFFILRENSRVLRERIFFVYFFLYRIWEFLEELYTWSIWLEIKKELLFEHFLVHIIVWLCLWEGGTPETLLLQYERLHTFCYCCRILGHQLWESLAKAIEDDGKEIWKYGSWMMASSSFGRLKTIDTRWWSAKRVWAVGK